MKSFEMWDQYTNNSWGMGGNRGQPWEWHLSWCGDLDIVGFSKPQSAYRTVLWDASPIEMLVHSPAPGAETVSQWGWPDERASWTWPGHEGEALQVRVFAKCAATGRVALTLNGATVPGSPASIGRTTEFTATFAVPYASGTLEARCAGDAGGAAATLTTAGAPAALLATADRASIAADRSDLSYVVVEVVDAQGVRVPDARVALSATLTGPVELAAFATGDPTDVGGFRTGARTSFEGRAVAILRPTGGSGRAALTVVADPAAHISPATVDIDIG